MQVFYSFDRLRWLQYTKSSATEDPTIQYTIIKRIRVFHVLKLAQNDTKRTRKNYSLFADVESFRGLKYTKKSMTKKSYSVRLLERNLQSLQTDFSPLGNFWILGSFWDACLKKLLTSPKIVQDSSPNFDNFTFLCNFQRYYFCDSRNIIETSTFFSKFLYWIVPIFCSAVTKRENKISQLPTTFQFSCNGTSEW